jgi:hypothetical protein
MFVVRRGVMTPAHRPLQLSVLGTGLLDPGLADWASGRILLGQSLGGPLPATVVLAPARLPPTERRRAGMVVKASLVVADQACAEAGVHPAGLATVFTSSTGDPSNCHLLCEALTAAERLVSPTRFTNSVHNAAAGYWHIATQSRRPSTSLAAFDASFAAGLLEAAVQCVATQEPVLLVACDVPYPEPLHAVRPVADVFALAFVLAPASAGGPVLSLQSVSEAPATVCSDAVLEAMRLNIPAARALPLLQALAGASANRTPAMVRLEGLPGLALEISL